MVLIGGGRQKYMAAKGEWQQSCCQADCSLLRTRWPLRGSVVHSCLISLLIHTESLWARGRMVLMSVLNACKALHLLLDLYLMFTEKGLPLCYIIISFMSVWPQLLKIKNEWSSIHCNCSLSWILYAKIDSVECLKCLWPSSNCLPSLWHFGCSAAQIPSTFVYSLS